jgi:hypothetical protein
MKKPKTIIAWALGAVLALVLWTLALVFYVEHTNHSDHGNHPHGSSCAAEDHDEHAHEEETACPEEDHEGHAHKTHGNGEGDGE